MERSPTGSPLPTVRLAKGRITPFFFYQVSAFYGKPCFSPAIGEKLPNTVLNAAGKNTGPRCVAVVLIARFRKGEAGWVRKRSLGLRT